jgi:hypothetical protein
MPSPEELKIILEKVTPSTFDKIMELFIINLTDSHKLFKPNNLGIERFAIFYYSHLFMSHNTSYFNKQQTTKPTITTKINYFNYLINFSKMNKNSTIKLLYKMLINDKNNLLVNGSYQREKFRINIDDEYFKYCLKHKLVNLSSRSKTQSSLSSSYSSRSRSSSY